jgi:hypothetical protein
LSSGVVERFQRIDQDTEGVDRPEQHGKHYPGQNRRPWPGCLLRSGHQWLNPHPFLLRIEMRERHHGRGDAFLVTVQLADLNLGPHGRMSNIHPA